MLVPQGRGLRQWTVVLALAWGVVSLVVFGGGCPAEPAAPKSPPAVPAAQADQPSPKPQDDVPATPKRAIVAPQAGKLRPS